MVINNLNSHSKIGFIQGCRLQWEEVQNSYVLVYPEGIVTLSTQAAEILHLCDKTHSYLEIISILQDKYGPSFLEKDVEDFLAEFMENNWLTPIGSED